MNVEINQAAYLELEFMKLQQNVTVSAAYMTQTYKYNQRLIK